MYSRYDADLNEQAKRDPSNPGLRQIYAERVRMLRGLLKTEGLTPLSGKRILDVGCGFGDELARLCGEGAEPARCVGVDLLSDRVDKAQAAHPDIRFICTDARRLEFESESFDLVLANVLFSSILDDGIAATVAGEMRRVLAPGGAIVWWDNRYPTPGNPNVRGYRLRDIERLFPGSRVRARTATVLPPLARCLGRAAPWLYPALARLPVLRARYLAIVR